MTMRIGTTIGAIFAATIFTTVASAERDQLALPDPDEFVDEAHRALYFSYNEALKEVADGIRKEHRPEAARVLAISLDERIRNLASEITRARLAELEKIQDSWFDAGAPAMIPGEIPEEFADAVEGYKLILENAEREIETKRQGELKGLIAHLDALALEHEKLEGGVGIESMRTLRGEARQLMKLVSRETKYGDLEVSRVDWRSEGPLFTRMVKHGDELLTITRLRGQFVGGGESVAIAEWDEGGDFGLAASAMQKDVQASAMALRHPKLDVANWNIWMTEIGSGSQRKKLIHSSRGFCYLAGIWGHHGDLARSEVSLDPTDGYYYISCLSQSENTGARAVIVEFPEGAEAPVFEIETAEWERGDPVQTLIKAEDGICLLSGVSGGLLGGGEEVNLTIGSDEMWHLGGRSLKLNTGAKAIVLKFKD